MSMAPLPTDSAPADSGTAGTTRGKTVVVKCKCCGDPFRARVADRKRGWGKYCSKSCKAIKQTQRTGRAQGGKQYLPNGGWIIGNRQYDRHGMFDGILMSQADLAAGGYGDADWDTPFGEGKF